MTEYNVSEKNSISQRASQGWLMKWRIGNTWLKSPGFLYNFMWDSYNEVITTCVAYDLGIINHLNYKLCILNIDGTRVIGCESPNYIKENTFELTLDKIVRINCIDRTSYYDIIKCIFNLFSLNIQSYMEDILLLDSIILNTDRNLWNISILIDNNKQGYLCSIYDSGSSLGLTGYNTGEFFEEVMYSNGFKATPFDIYYENQLKYIRNNRNYTYKNKYTKQIIDLLYNKFTVENNYYHVINPLERGQIEFIESIINKRVKGK